MSLITLNTLVRAFGDGSAQDIQSANIAMRGAKFRGADSIKDLILSMLTFGIYSFVKSSIIEQKRATIEVALQELRTQMEMDPGEQAYSVEVDGKTLDITQEYDSGVPSLKLYLDGHEFCKIDELDFRRFGILVDAQIWTPSSTAVDLVNRTIGDNLERLRSPDGFASTQGSRVYLDDEDIFAGEKFDKDATTEWCLVRRDSGIYDLAT
ncbi:hypothetical protein [Paraburkholderia sp. RL17-373-BIF-A]|uniref:hypothetical protein n=1 Tax=Paraburkholderia sp. RL17-373-BIF-A TaxID=3031629 RepID=UPI0038BBB5F5